MELAGEKVFMAPAVHETRVDASRKTPLTPNTNLSEPEETTRASSTKVSVRYGHDYARATELAEFGDDLFKNARRHHHKHHNRERRRGPEEDRRPKDHKHGQAVSGLRTTSSEFAPQAVLNSGDGVAVFVEDRKGDRYNVMYGSVHRYNIPRYRTAGHRRVVGLGRTYKILQASDGNRRILSDDHFDSVERLKPQSLLMGIVDKNTQFRVVPENTNTQARAADLQRDFLSLSAHGSRKRRRLEVDETFQVVAHDHSPVSDRVSAEREVLPQRRALSESGTDASDSDVGSQSSQENSFEQFRNDARQQKTMELSRAVHEHPQDIEAWLALVKHQDGVLVTKDGTIREPTNAERYGLTDVKISLYEAALSKNTSNPRCDRLVIGLMEEGSKVWDSKKLASQWRSVLKEHAQFPNLWIKYLNFEQSNFLTFTYDQCKSVYSECVRITRTQLLGRGRDQSRIYVLLRLTAFMKDAGYTEHAVGLWQAMLEYNYFHPAMHERQTEESSFEEFWNSEVARVGEEGAQGWKSGLSPELPSMSDASTSLVDRTHIFQSWSDCEQERALHAVLPARTLDEINDDDPYRVIISSDVREYLFRVTEPESKTLLLNAFLLFCGLPPLPTHDPLHQQQWRMDGFLHSFDLSTAHDASDAVPHFQSPTSSPTTSLVADTSTMFADNKHWFSCWQDRPSPTSNRRMSKFLHLALRQLADANPDNEELAEYLIAHQLQSDAKEARKLTKALLKQRPSNLRLYNAYALVECRLGNFEGAERVWSTALSMSGTFPNGDGRNTVLLWHTWIWQLLDRAETRKAFALLLATPDGQVDVSELSLSDNHDVHSTAILKARRTFESNLAQATSLHNSDLIVHYSGLLALLAYFTSADPLRAALAVYAGLLDPPAAPSTLTPNQSSTLNPATSTERLHQFRARILLYHMRTRSSFRATEIANLLSTSLSLFPTNSTFQSIYHTYTRHTLLIDRVRSVIPTLYLASHSASAKDSIVPAIFNIWSEMTRPIYTGSTRHSVRAAFEHALEPAKPGSHSPAIWTWYLRWELSIAEAALESGRASPSHGQGSPDLARAQDVFYRGMRACPWAKAFYMLAFTAPRLRDAMGFDGLRRIYETMVEKGLRMHVELGDVLEDYGA